MECRKPAVLLKTLHHLHHAIRRLLFRHFHIIPLCHLAILLLNMRLIYQKTCVICSKASHKIECMKYSISEKGRAEKFLKASLSLVLLDNIYTRTSDLQHTSSVFDED